jgi:hypothetical protein
LFQQGWSCQPVGKAKWLAQKPVLSKAFALNAKLFEE